MAKRLAIAAKGEEIGSKTERSNNPTIDRAMGLILLLTRPISDQANF